MGARQPHDGPARAGERAGSEAGGEPDRGDGLQPLSRDRGLAGLRLSRAGRWIDPAPQFTGDAYASDAGIPRDPAEALDLFDRASEIHEVLHPRFASIYSAVKRLEYGAFLQVISPWEREHLLLNV